MRYYTVFYDPTNVIVRSQKQQNKAKYLSDYRGLHCMNNFAKVFREPIKIFEKFG